VEPVEQTIFALRMASLLPEETIAELELRHGAGVFEQLSGIQRVALVTVAIEGRVTHARLHSMTAAHPRDATVALASLVQRGFLESSGRHKGTFYFFPGEPPQAQAALTFDGEGQAADPAGGLGRASGVAAGSSVHGGPSSVHSGPSSVHNGPSSVHSGPSSVHSGPSSVRSEEERQALEHIAAPLRAKKRATPSQMEAVLLELCWGRTLTLAELAAFTGRAAETLRTHHLAKLVTAGKMRLRYPEAPTHPAQGYTTA
jgi:ATP-dependent DNA helicase RecG